MAAQIEGREGWDHDMRTIAYVLTPIIGMVRLPSGSFFLFCISNEQ
jgi:hypothetical protein